MKIIVVSPKNKTVFNFRGDLIKDMIAKGHEVSVICPDKSFYEEIMALGVKELIEVPLIKDNTSIRGDLAYTKALKKVFSEKNPDTVFSYTIKPVIYGSIAAKSANVPNIYAMVTGLGRIYTSKSLKTKLIKLVTKILYRKAFKCCKKVIFQNSDDIYEFVSQKYLPIEKCEKINGSGVNMERFEKTPLPQTPVFLMVGRIIREKGVIEYCEAATKVKLQIPDARFILLGGFDSSIGALKKEDIEPYINSGAVEFPGECKDPVPYYRESSVFVLPSYYREGLPRTILEAMSSGRPIITTDWVGCREAVEDGRNGFLVNIKDSDMLAEKMLLLAKDRSLAEYMANESYGLCRQKYEVSIINREMRDVIGY